MICKVYRAGSRHGDALWNVGKNGPRCFDAAIGRTIFGQGVDGGGQSEEVSAQIDAEVKNNHQGARKESGERHQETPRGADAIAQKLIEVETIERDDLKRF